MTLLAQAARWMEGGGGGGGWTWSPRAPAFRSPTTSQLSSVDRFSLLSGPRPETHRSSPLGASPEPHPLVPAARGQHRPGLLAPRQLEQSGAPMHLEDAALMCLDAVEQLAGPAVQQVHQAVDRGGDDARGAERKALVAAAGRERHRDLEPRGGADSSDKGSEKGVEEGGGGSGEGRG